VRLEQARDPPPLMISHFQLLGATTNEVGPQSKGKRKQNKNKKTKKIKKLKR